MTRRFKVLGAAFIAVLAMSALVASAAQATEFFHSHVEKTIVTGTGIGEQKFTLPSDAGGVATTVICKKAEAEGTEVGAKNVGGTLGTTWTTESSTVHPIYSECTLGGVEKATVRTNKCHFKLFPETTSTAGTLGPMGNVEINECPEAAPIEIEILGGAAIIEVKNQTINHCIRYDNNKTGGTNEWDIKVVATCGIEGTTKTTGVAWKCKKGGAACEAAFGVKAGTEASYVGEITVKGFEDTCGATPCETGAYTGKESAQTGIWKGPADPAQATEFFHSHVEKTIITGTGGEQKFTFPNHLGASTIVCKKATVEGTEVGAKNVGGTFGTTWTTETSTVHPTYSECPLGAENVTVRTNKCHFKLFPETTSTAGTLGPMGNVEINECPEAAPIEIEIFGGAVIIEIKNQLINHCLRYDNNKTGTTNEWDINVVATCGTEVGTTATSGLAWKCKKGGVACEAAFGVKAGNELAYSGEFTVKGFEDQCGATPCETGAYTGKEGAQTGIWKGPAE